MTISAEKSRELRMDKKSAAQRDYFDALAPAWRVGFPVPDEVFDELFSTVNLTNKTVLDVGCGAGILTKYLAEKCLSVVGIDVSGKMIARAKSEVRYPNVSFSVADFYDFSGSYDCIFLFDAYPHFADKSSFANKANDLLVPNGILVIAFDESRQKINAHHNGSAAAVSVGLRTPQEELAPFLSAFSVRSVRDDDRYLLVLQKTAR